jgi:hypothetical protein
VSKPRVLLVAAPTGTSLLPGLAATLAGLPITIGPAATTPNSVVSIALPVPPAPSSVATVWW